jgi:hypothetical protein
MRRFALGENVLAKGRRLGDSAALNGCLIVTWQRPFLLEYGSVRNALCAGVHGRNGLLREVPRRPLSCRGWPHRLVPVYIREQVIAPVAAPESIYQ